MSIEHAFDEPRNCPDLDDNTLALVRDVIEVAQAARRLAHGPGELGDVMKVADRVRSRFEGIASTPTARFQTSTDCNLDAKRSPISWLVAHTGMGHRHATALAKTSITLQGCPHALRAAKEGRISPAQVRALLKVRTSKLLFEWTSQEEKLVATVATLTVAGAEAYLQSWADAMSPDGGNDKFKEDTDATQLHLSKVGDRYRADGQFDVLSGAVLESAVEAKINQWRETASSTTTPAPTPSCGPPPWSSW